MAVDTITADIIGKAVQAVSDEMFAVLRNAAMTPIIYEVLDMGTGITSATGEMLSSGAGIPAFVGVLDKAVVSILQQHPKGICPGDVFIVNDPFYGGVTHLNDAVLAMPVFVDGCLLAWTANIAHWTDIGGMEMTSTSVKATEIYQEGLRLPAVKVIERGETRQDIVNIIKLNSRLPDFVEGDLWAAIAAVRTGDARLQEIIKKYTVEVFLEAMQRHLEFGERIARRRLATLRAGTYLQRDEQDDGTSFAVRVEITKDEFIVDLTDNIEQRSAPFNITRDNAIIAAQMVLLALIGESEAVSGGMFRPLKVLTKLGSVFDPLPPAPFGWYSEISIRLHDLIWHCLADAGFALPSGTFSSVCSTRIMGIHPDTGKSFVMTGPQVGGWGGSSEHDGASGQFSAFHGETFNCPVEVAETKYGLRVEKLTFNDQPGGAGRYRGGKGIIADFRLLSEQGLLTCGHTRTRVPVWSLQGGEEGSLNYVELIRADGPTERFSFTSSVPIKRDDIVRVVTANGGGYGDPTLRDPQMIAADIKNGFETPERAKQVYNYRT